jgi:flavin-dependent thymidylate synthase
MTEEPSTDVTKYVDKAMFSAEGMPDDAVERPRVTLLSATPDPLGAVAAMSMMYEGEVVRDLRDVTDEQRVHYWGEIKKTHLKAPLEAIDLHFMVEGVTRAFTHQMVRQRTAVYAQESMRFAVKDEIAARPGPLISGDGVSKKVWDGAIEAVWGAYQHLIANGVPAEEARGLLPHDTLTRLHYKTNLRNLVDHLGNRLCTQAQFEWRLVAADLRRAIRSHIAFVPDPFSVRTEREQFDTPINILTGEVGTPGPVRKLVDDCIGRSTGWQFRLIADDDLFQPVCFAVGHCPFKAGFDRGCTIRDRVDAGKFDEIKPEEWLADPTAGWVR